MTARSHLAMIALMARLARMSHNGTDGHERERFRTAVEKSAGGWKAEDHPELTGVEEVAGYVEALRRDWSRES
ncbi:hypothetical protein LIP_2353 [Limnochorda pilosa]|uniref:Uncharacterized protein n=1 Tax=Limnochorda pilosa TaxID=1555112 RepID=A0A0K2SN09_LIMPI|nr:hypothetical protein LIP_2353 [Limnochorda pilosa]